MSRLFIPRFVASLCVLFSVACLACAQEKNVVDAPKAKEKATHVKRTDLDANDPIRKLQSDAVRQQKTDWGHWGIQPDRYSTWTNHSNRLVPMYTFGITLDALRAEGSCYQDPKRLKRLYGRVPDGTVNPTAMYFDQTDVYRLQLAAVDAGYSNIILVVFDGMDWQTTRAAALYNNPGRRGPYTSGRGSGLLFQDDRRTHTDFGLICTSPRLGGAKSDVNAQTVIHGNSDSTGGYDPGRGGDAPWNEQSRRDYLLGLSREQRHTVTDSAAAATSMTSGIKTYNGAINVNVNGKQVLPIARTLQAEEEFKIGIVTNVPVTHATPAAAYANNVSRKDYQDIARDMLGLSSSSHRKNALPGVDVLIGGGWGEGKGKDKVQGENYLPGNPYIHQDDIQRVDVKNDGKYIVAQRTKGKSGNQLLMAAATRAADDDQRLLGLFGTKGGHLPFQTADGKFNPTFDLRSSETYSGADISENPTLADMTRAALLVLEQAVDGFWLMIEAGDVDWANHANNIDNSIGAVFSGEEAVRAVMDWVDENNAWEFTAVIVTADHGHFLVIDDPSRIVEAGNESRTK